MDNMTSRSFDFYDTLVTRIVGTPADIFSIIGCKLQIDDFRQLRITAEKRAREVYGEQITLNRIYQQIPLTEKERRRAYEIEMELESDLVVPVRRIACTLQDADIIVSDMYHDEAFFRGVLSRVIPGKTPTRIFISGSAGISKANGLLWRQIAAEFPNHRLHLGDNVHADITQARRNGFRTSHVIDAQLNKYEKALSRSGFDGSLIAGASKAARVSLIDSDTDAIQTSIITVFASVIAPLIYAFSEWIIQRCLDQGIRRAYFLARDGFLPFKTCETLCRARNIPLECKYIYVSRHALHLPGFTDIEIASDWLLEPTRDLSLRTLATRGGIPIALLQEAAAGHLPTNLDRRIPATEWDCLRAVIRDPLVVAAIERASKESFRSAIEYCRSVSLTESDPAGLIDIGWNGRMQRSLRALLDKAGEGPEKFTGMYVCLSGRTISDRRDSYDAFLFKCSSDDQKPPVYDRYRAVLEAAFSSDHPTTVGFRMNDSQSYPVFGHPVGEAMLRRIRLQHNVVSTFTANVVRLEKTTGRNIQVPFNVLASNLRRMLEVPSGRDGLAFCNFLFGDGQTENGEQEICRRKRLGELRYSTEALGWWPEGTLAASGYRNLISLLHVIETNRRYAANLRNRLRLR